MAKEKVIGEKGLKAACLQIASYINQKILDFINTATNSIEEASKASGTTFKDGESLQDKFDNGDIVAPTKFSDLDDDSQLVQMTEEQYNEIDQLIDALKTSE